MTTSRPTERKRLSVLQVLATVALAGLLVYGSASFLGRLQGTVVILIASTFLAYLIYPLIRIFQRWMPMIAALLLVYAGIAAAFALVIVFFVPPLIVDATTFFKGLPAIVTALSRDIADPHNPLFGWLPTPVRDYLASLPQQFIVLIQTYGLNAAQRIAAYLFSVVAVIAAVIVVPILTAYILLDFENILRTFLGFFSERSRPKVKAVLLDLDRVLGGFIRGQLIDAVVVGVLIFIALLLLHVPYAYLVAVFSGVFQVVPYLGAIAGFIPAVILAVINNGPTNAIFVAVAFAAIHQLDGNVIAPRIMRGSVGLSPVWMVLSVLVFTELFGLIGTFVAVPAAAMLRVMKMHFLPPPVESEEAQPAPVDEELRLGDAIAAEADAQT
jgi:predicted PurR-regulated permease PerM